MAKFLGSWPLVICPLVFFFSFTCPPF
jgi:hypothetical protein